MLAAEPFPMPQQLHEDVVGRVQRLILFPQEKAAAAKDHRPVTPSAYGPDRSPAFGSPVGGGAWSVAAGGPSSSVRIGFKPWAQTS